MADDTKTTNETATPSAPNDPTSMLMGWLVGRQIAGMRKEKHHE